MDDQKNASSSTDQTPSTSPQKPVEVIAAKDNVTVKIEPYKVLIDSNWTAEQFKTGELDILQDIIKPITIDCRSVPGNQIELTAKMICRLAKLFSRIQTPIMILQNSTALIKAIDQAGSNPYIQYIKNPEDIDKKVQESKEALFNSQPKDSKKIGSFDANQKLSVTAKTTKAADSPMIDVKYINPFIDSTMNLFKVNAGTEVKIGAPTKKSKTDKVEGELLGFITLSSTNFQGTVILGFPEATLQKMLEKVLGSKDAYSQNDLKGAVGEFLNIIFTNGKASLNKMGNDVKSALPTVETEPPPDLVAKVTKRLAVPCTCDLGNFSIEIWAMAA